MESFTGRSMDPLLPVGERGRKKVPDTDYDVTQKHRSERHKPHVCGSSKSPVSRLIVLNRCLAFLIIIVCILFRIGMKNGTESPVWPCGRPVLQHHTPPSRTGITNLRNSSLNLAPMKPVCVYNFLLHKWCCFHWTSTLSFSFCPIPF